MDLPIPEDLEGSVPEALFESEYLRSHPVVIKATASRSAAGAAPSTEVDPQMEAEVMGQLRALGYME
jgi:hypothetical protein